MLKQDDSNWSQQVPAQGAGGVGRTNHRDGASSAEGTQRTPVLREKDPDCPAETEACVCSSLDGKDMSKADRSESLRRGSSAFRTRTYK